MTRAAPGVGWNLSGSNRITRVHFTPTFQVVTSDSRQFSRTKGERQQHKHKEQTQLHMRGMVRLFKLSLGYSSRSQGHPRTARELPHATLSSQPFYSREQDHSVHHSEIRQLKFVLPKENPPGGKGHCCSYRQPPRKRAEEPGESSQPGTNSVFGSPREKLTTLFLQIRSPVFLSRAVWTRPTAQFCCCIT